MKIGILTFHCAHNYGAVLQAYALQEKLKVMGNDVEIIDYRPDYVVNPYLALPKNVLSNKPIQTFKKIVSSALTYCSKIKRRKSFNQFIKNNLLLSRSTNNSIPNNYDLYIMGSDQIWNYNITKGFDRIFFGFFDTKDESIKITYAASFGNAIIGKEETKFLSKSLKNFNGVSLREKDYIQPLQSIVNTELVNVLDPTLILSESVWNNLAIKPSTNKKYVLVYQVRANTMTNEIANKVAKQLNATVIEIPAWIKHTNILKKYTSTSPEEFLGWIKHAECIITSSFHGTAFSVIFNKPFYTVNLNDGSEKRSKYLLESLGLSERLVDKDLFFKYEPVDFQKANQKHETLKQYSINYLKKFAISK